MAEETQRTVRDMLEDTFEWSDHEDTCAWTYAWEGRSPDDKIPSFDLCSCGLQEHVQWMSSFISYLAINYPRVLEVTNPVRGCKP